MSGNEQHQQAPQELPGDHNGPATTTLPTPSEGSPITPAIGSGAASDSAADQLHQEAGNHLNGHNQDGQQVSATDPSLGMSTTTAHAYASNGLQVLQAATDAAQAFQNTHQHQLQLQAQAQQQPQLGNQGHGGPDQVAALATGSGSGSPEQSSGVGGNLLHHPFPPVAAPAGDPRVNPKLTRLRRACDMCSLRKIKCDASGPPCQPCQELSVDCTYNRTMKRRGPPNKHALAHKAAKQARLDGNDGQQGPSQAGPSGLGGYGAAVGNNLNNPFGQQPTPSPHNAAQALVSIAEGPTPARLDAEAIAPMPVLELLVDDYFTYIHPLCPFPHEPTFRDAFANRQDRTNPEFLSLLAAMVGALAASFPRSARQHLKSQHSTHLFPRAIVMIEKCRDIALETRGAQWAAKQPKTLDDAATSYLIGLAAGYTLNFNLFRYFTSECLSLIRELGFNRPKHPGDLPTFGNDNCSPNPLPFHHIKDQIGKRIFYSLLLGIRSFSQLGASNADLVIPPGTPSLPYPALPENVDDRWIMANEIQHSENNTVTLLTGFRFAIEIYTTMNAIVSVELVYGIRSLPWSGQQSMLRDALVAAKNIVDRLPAELQLTASGSMGNGGEMGFDDDSLQYVPPAAYPNNMPPQQNDVRAVIKGNAQRRRQLQYDIQKANIFVSQLATRSYFVELYFTLWEGHMSDVNKAVIDDSTEAGRLAKEAEDAEAERVLELMTAERELIVQNLLHVLGTIPQRNMEPNGSSLINKIRQVASTLLHAAPERKGPVAVKAGESLERLIDILIKLEGTSTGIGVGGSSVGGSAGGQTNMTPEEEEEELRLWSSLRDCQEQFAAHGGYAGNL